GSGTATGTVTFLDGASTLCTSTMRGGCATFSSSTLSVGSHSITVVYGGDSNFTGSTSSTLTQTVNQDGTTSAVVSSANPSAFGQSLNFTVTGSTRAPGRGTATGTATSQRGAATLRQ